MRQFAVNLGLLVGLSVTGFNIGDVNAQGREQPPPRNTEQPQRTQRSVEPVQQPVPAHLSVVQPASGDFQRRRVADKQLTLQHFQINVLPQQLHESFTLTPRTPYVAMRGSLESHRASHQLRDGASPWVLMLDSVAHTTIHIQLTQGKRFLIECQAATPGLRAWTSWQSKPIITYSQFFSGTVVELFSIISPVITSETVSVKMDRVVQHGSNSGPWSLYGCEVTRFQ